MTDRYARYTRLTFDHPHDRVLRVTMNRPERLNAADQAMHAELGNVWRDIDQDPDVNAVILTGAGKAFSAGGESKTSMAGDGMDRFQNVYIPRRYRSSPLLSGQVNPP